MIRRELLSRRSLCANAKKLSLKEPLILPSIGSKNNSTTNKFVPFDTRISRLENGLRVASEEYFGEFCTIGVAIQSGSRYEGTFSRGISRLVEKLAFSSTLQHETREQIAEVIEKSGALVDCQSTRDTVAYATSCHRDHLEKMIEIISNAAWRPLISEPEIAEAALICDYEAKEVPQKIEIEPYLTDLLHQAAFRSNTLGNSQFIESDDLQKISREDIFGFLSRHYDPRRIVLAGIGVDHDELRQLGDRYFDERTTTWALNPKVLPDKVPEIDLSTAQYTGGEIRINQDLSMVGIGTSYPHLAHVALGFESCGFRDDDFIAFCVLQSLLGGGGSFSAGGPGKGMFTRLYVDVLNRCHSMYRCTAFNHAYADGGVFCIQASAPPKEINNTLIELAVQFLQLTAGAEAEELERAKVQLKSQIMMNLEIRPVLFEDLARQVLGHGHRRKPEEVMALIDRVRSEDIARIGAKMLASRPSLAAFGKIDGLVEFSRLEEAIARADARLLLPTRKVFSWQ